MDHSNGTLITCGLELELYSKYSGYAYILIIVVTSVVKRVAVATRLSTE